METFHHVRQTHTLVQVSLNEHIYSIYTFISLSLLPLVLFKITRPFIGCATIALQYVQITLCHTCPPSRT